MRRMRSATSTPTSPRQGYFTTDRRLVPGRGLGLLLSGWVVVTVAGRAHALTGDASSPGALVLTCGVVVASLVAIGAGCAKAIEAAESPRRYVFHSRPTFWTAVILLLGGLGLAARLVVRRPFDRIFSYGDLTALTIADTGAILATVASFVGCGIAVFAWWDARRDERSWTRPIPG